MTSKTKMIKEQQEKQKLAEIAKRELEVQVTAADANTVNFEEVFQDNLPQKAIDLEQFVKTFEKDATNDEKTVNILRNAEKNKNIVYNLLPDDTKIHVSMMVDDMITVPEHQKTVFA